MSRTFAIAVVAALVVLGVNSAACPSCTLAQCEKTSCTQSDPYACLAGMSQGGCSGSPLAWSNDTVCSECCNAAACSSMPRFECSAKCSADMCHSMKRCVINTPYMCTNGSNQFGCSASPSFWPVNDECTACCDVRSCVTTCTTCTAAQCQSNACGTTTPYTCTSGPMEGACGASPNYFSGEPSCYSCCDSSNCGSSRFSCDSKPCPESICHSTDRCNLALQYMCTNGTAANGCSGSKTYWPSYPQCTDCCDVKTCEFTCPACTEEQCGAVVCPKSVPYQCTGGPLDGGCSGSATFFGQQSQCYSCCDSSKCKSH